MEILRVNTIDKWLRDAAYFNRQWHEYDGVVLSEVYEGMMLKYHQQRKSSLLRQKENCQITAIRLAYDDVKQNPNQPCAIHLVIDPNEKGIDGQGIFYSLSASDATSILGCHIPRESLLEYLTDDELAFFEIN